MKVFFSVIARADLRDIAFHIAKDNVSRSRSFSLELKKAAFGLVDYPLRYPLVEEFTHIGLRKRICGNYIILYRVEPKQITIVRVIHASRDYANEQIVFE